MTVLAAGPRSEDGADHLAAAERQGAAQGVVDLGVGTEAEAVKLQCDPDASGQAAIVHLPMAEIAEAKIAPRPLYTNNDRDAFRPKRKQEGAPSIFDRSPAHLRHSEVDPNYNSFIREPGHVEYAGTLGLGVFPRSSITEKVISF